MNDTLDVALDSLQTASAAARFATVRVTDTQQ